MEKSTLSEVRIGRGGEADARDAHRGTVSVADDARVHSWRHALERALHITRMHLRRHLRTTESYGPVCTSTVYSHLSFQVLNAQEKRTSKKEEVGGRAGGAGAGLVRDEIRF